MEGSKEITFGNKPMMKGYGGMKYKAGGFPDLTGDGKVTKADVLKGRGVDMKKSGGLYSAAEQAENIARVKKNNSMMDYDHQTQVKKQTGGVKTALPPTNSAPTGSKGYKVPVEKKVPTEAERKAALERFKKSAEQKVTSSPPSDLIKKFSKKKTGGKSMEPGGGGRFAKMVGKLKGEGKSEDSAKAIAASIGRKKYGKSKFQEMAAKGKKGLGGMSDSTSANDAGMEMMENMEAMGPKKPKKGSSGTRDTGPNVKRTKKARKNIGKCNRGEICFD